MGRLCLSLVNLLQTLFSLWGSWVRFLADLGSNKAFLLKSVKVLVMGSLGGGGCLRNYWNLGKRPIFILV